MKGFTKTIKRTPHMLTSKVGMSKKSTDPEFDDYQRHFTTMEQATEKLLKDTKAFTDAVATLFMAGSGFSNHFSVIFHPISGEYDLIGKNPDAAHTIRNVDAYSSSMEELKITISPELELIESRVVGPTKEFQQVLKTIRKTITKRDHKLIDYDRFNNSLAKLRDKKEKSLSDEKNLFKLEQDFENATQEYDYINMTLKNELPQFMQLATQFIDPLFHSFYYMQLNIYYLLLEKVQAFASEKYDIAAVPGSQIEADYTEKRTDAWHEIESLNITKRIISTSKMVQSQRSLSGGSGSFGRSPSAATTASASTVGSRSVSGPSGFVKKAPPPPPSSAGMVAPPPYSPSSAASAAAGKRAPPPPPPLKPKPAPPPPQPEYVIALYDYAAQADGDLSFNTGDHIEIVERGASVEDWWTGKLNGITGVFPGNYVKDA